jgi:hypothetical protein
MNRTTPRQLLTVAGIVIAAVALAGGCSSPFGWAGAMPASWDSGGTGEDPTADDPTTGAEVQAIPVTGPSFTLAWDDDGAQADGYNVYWRAYGTSAWQLLAADLTEPSVEVNEGELAYGSYEFAVASMVGGAESELHHSFDQSADPDPWYLEWSAG